MTSLEMKILRDLQIKKIVCPEALFSSVAIIQIIIDKMEITVFNQEIVTHRIYGQKIND